MYVCDKKHIYLYMYVLSYVYICTHIYTDICILALSYYDKELVHRTHAHMYIYMNSKKRTNINYKAYYIKAPKSLGARARHHSASIMRFDGCMGVCVWLCVCVCVCARARARVFFVYACVHVCVCTHSIARVHAHVCAALES